MKKIVFVAGLAVCAALVGCSGQSSAQSGAGQGPAQGAAQGAGAAGGAQPSLPQVGFVTMAAQDVPLEALLSGRAVASASAQVRPQVTGIVQKQRFVPGARVVRGQPLYQLDDAALRIERDRAAAAAERAQASADAAQATLARNMALADGPAAPSAQVLQDLRTTAAATRADAAAARAALAQAELNLRHARIEAPIDGRIGLSAVTAGALVTAGQASALAEIVQTQPMHIDFTQSMADVLAWKKAASDPSVAAAPLQVILEDGSVWPHPARLIFDGLTTANPTTGSVTLRAEVANPDGVLVPGMFVQVRRVRGRAQAALRVPQRAVTREMGGAASVLVVVEKDGADVLQKRSVQLGDAVGADWLVVEGLASGDRVAIDGLQRARAGSKVRAVPAAAQGQRLPVDAAAAQAALKAAAQAAKK